MKALKLVRILFIVLIVAFSASILYDKFIGGNDGYIAGLAFRRLFSQAAVLVAIFGIIGAGTGSKNKLLQNISLSIGSLFTCLLLVELFSFTVFKTGLISADLPRHHLNTNAPGLSGNHRPFWGDYNPYFAKWYLPTDTLKRENCAGDSLFSFTNSYGARDRERSRSSDSLRVAVLGDSFIEGYMVNTPDRLTNLLEAATGKEHLNFGINGTSPINYFLTYKHLAKSFDHEVLIVGILPANDFEDFTNEKLSSLVETPLYRPYWDGSYPNYELRYSLASINQSSHSLFHFQNPEKITASIDSVFRAMSFQDKTKAVLRDNMYTWHLIDWARQKIAPEPKADYSRFQQYSQKEWNIFSFSIEQLLNEATNKKVILLLLPTLSDVRAYTHNSKPRLAGEIQQLIKKRSNVGMIDLLPYFHSQKNNWEQYYVVCDGHWSTEGERFASSVILNHPVYKAAVSGK